LSSVLAVSLVSLIGLSALSISPARLHRIVSGLVSFAVGALLGDAFIHLIPQSFAGDGLTLNASLLILAGLLLFFIVEKLLRHRHGTLHEHEHVQERWNPHLATLNLFGDSIHNFIDGVLIGASYLVHPSLGFSTTIAVLFHEIPQEFGDFGILLKAGLSIKKAILYNLASASMAIVGAILTLLIGHVAQQTITQILVPVTAGGFVYIAAANLIPELQCERGIRSLLVQAVLISLGISVMGLLKIFE
jgi:zinc and cadmium transporter